MKFEYKLQVIDGGTIADVDKALNNAGKFGWEAFAVTTAFEGQITRLYFKRPVAPKIEVRAKAAK